MLIILEKSHHLDYTEHNPQCTNFEHVTARQRQRIMTCVKKRVHSARLLLLTLCTHSFGLIKRRVCMRGARAGPKNRDWLFEVFGAQTYTHTHTYIRRRDAFCGQPGQTARGCCVCAREVMHHIFQERWSIYASITLGNNTLHRVNWCGCCSLPKDKQHAGRTEMELGQENRARTPSG
jgi:hypothetical protein